MVPYANNCLLGGYSRSRLEKNPEKAQQTKGNCLDFIVGKSLTEFIFVNALELINGLLAKLLWRCFHIA